METAKPLHAAERCFGLSKAERLSGRTAVDHLFREGKAGFVYPFRYLYSADEPKEGISGEPSPDVKVLFSVPKRSHKRANKRNLLKRRSREAYRQLKLPLYTESAQSGQAVRLALIYCSKEVEDYTRIRNAVKKIISEISGRL